MARVVQRKSNNPPYLLIVFVFLFLLATAMAVLTFMKNEDLTIANQTQEKMLARLASDQQLQKGEAAAIMAESTEGTVVGALTKHIEVLTQDLTGVSCTAKHAHEQVEDLVKMLGTRNGLIQSVREMKDQRDKRQAELERARTELGQAMTEKTQVIETNKKLQAEFEKTAADLTTQNKTLNERNAAIEEEVKTKLEGIQTEHATAVDGLNKTIADMTQKVQSLQWKNQQLDMKLQATITKFRKENTPHIDINTLVRTPKGKVNQVVEDVIYIDRGAKDRIMPGMPFSVYGSSGIPEDGKGKATVVVTNVFPNTSECRILEQKITNPIMVNDVIGNIAYDPTRKYTFVVKGEFDLHSVGKPSRQGAEEVKELISRSGGKIEDDLSVNTDFLVMGEEPVRPPKPAEDASPQDQAVNQAQMKAYDDYKQSKETAGGLFVPVLNTNRFLSLMGYAAIKNK